MACFLSVPENKKYFKPDEPHRDQGEYYLKILYFRKGIVCASGAYGL